MIKHRYHIYLRLKKTKLLGNYGDFKFQLKIFNAIGFKDN